MLSVIWTKNWAEIIIARQALGIKHSQLNLWLSTMIASLFRPVHLMYCLICDFIWLPAFADQYIWCTGSVVGLDLWCISTPYRHWTTNQAIRTLLLHWLCSGKSSQGNCLLFKHFCDIFNPNLCLKTSHSDIYFFHCFVITIKKWLELTMFSPCQVYWRFLWAKRICLYYQTRKILLEKISCILLFVH